VKTDPADNTVLEAAVEGQADFVVSGDHDLLDIGSYEGIEIVTPARFTTILASSSQQP
jgi:predicted nucleic acid-binding protein